MTEAASCVIYLEAAINNLCKDHLTALKKYKLSQYKLSAHEWKIIKQRAVDPVADTMQIYSRMYASQDTRKEEVHISVLSNYAETR